MKKKMFDTYEFRFAMSYVNSNPKFAKIKLEEYLSIYPNDYSSYPFYASVLITLGEFAEAEKILHQCERWATKDKSFPLHKLKILKQNILSNIIRLLTYQGRFEELKKIFENNARDIEKLDLNRVNFYMKSKLNSIGNIEREHNSYLFRQIIKYQEDDFINHIKKHMEQYKDPNLKTAGIFSLDFPMMEVLKEIKSRLKKEKCLFSGYYEDFYTFKYPNCGAVNGFKTDYFQVACFHNTDNIITMYPSTVGEKLSYIDLSYLVKKEIEDKPKEKIKKPIK